MDIKLKGLVALFMMSIITLHANSSLKDESSLVMKGDFNGDGVTDILTRNKNDGNLYTILLNTDGTASTLNKIVGGVGESEWKLLYADKFNNDATTDVLIQRKADGNIYTVLVGSDGTSATLNKVVGGIIASDWNILNAKDFNGDGVIDVLLQRKSDGNLYTLLLDSVGTSSTLNKIQSGLLTTEWDILQSGDFNNDGVSDILAQRKSDGNLYTILVSADGTSSSLNKIVSGLPSSEWEILDNQSFNSDGTTDVLAQRKSDGNLYTILLNSDGTSATLNKIVSGLPSSEWDFLKTGDFNNDGITDILAQRKSDGNLYTLLLSSDGTSASLNKIANGLFTDEWDIISSPDLNGDGMDDILLQNKVSGHLYSLYVNDNGTNAILTKVVSGIPSSEWIILDASKYNNDGTIDVLIQRKSDGNIYTLLLNSDGTASSLNGIVSALSLDDWEVIMADIDSPVLQPLLIVRIEFNDYQFDNSAEVWSQKIFGTNEGELNHYYNEISYGNFAFVSASETDGVNDGLITVSLNENHPDNSNVEFKERLKSALTLADQYIDFSAYDTNGNAAISDDELQIMFLVAGGESATGVHPGIWAHAWGFTSSNAPILDGIKVMSYEHNGGYSRFGEKHFALDGEDASIGIIAHELGHAVFGLPDLYDTNGGSEGIGNFGLMGAGSWGYQSGENPGATPVHMTGWSKVKAGFIEPVVLNSTVQNLSLRGTHFDDYVLYKLQTGRAGEYFLIENRVADGYDRGLHSLAGSSTYLGGLSILHIDDNIDGNRDEEHKQVDVEEANDAGLDASNNRGHINNLFFAGNSDSFTTDTTPNSDRYDGEASGVSITNISDRSATMRADIEIN